LVEPGQQQEVVDQAGHPLGFPLDSLVSWSHLVGWHGTLAAQPDLEAPVNRRLTHKATRLFGLDVRALSMHLRNE
jgi:hypothetical protein